MTRVFESNGDSKMLSHHWQRTALVGDLSESEGAVRHVQIAINASIQQKMQSTVWTSGCASWYLDASGRNTTLWPGFSFDTNVRSHGHF